jgi:hypothetical protein
MQTILTVVGISLFGLYFFKIVLHYRYLLKQNAISDNIPFSSFLPKGRLRLYLLLFLSSIMFPIFSKNGNKVLRRKVNLVVLLFYCSLILFFFLQSNLDKL